MAHRRYIIVDYSDESSDFSNVDTGNNFDTEDTRSSSALAIADEEPQVPMM
jgi:hypothetical protein